MILIIIGILAAIVVAIAVLIKRKKNPTPVEEAETNEQ